MEDDAAEYITVEEVAAILGLSLRQASRYATKVRTRRVGQRMLYHREDILEQARIKGIEHRAHVDARSYRPKPKLPSAEIMPPGEMLDYLRERDAQVSQLSQQMVQAAHRIGELEGLLQQRLLPEDATQLRVELEVAKQRIADLERQIEQPQAPPREPQQPLQPWWKRIFGGRDRAADDDLGPG